MYKRKIQITDDVFNPEKYSQEEMQILDKIGKEITEGESNIKKIKHQIEKFPNLPGLYNYLSIAYKNKNNSKKADEAIFEVVEKFPDYLFGKINLANYYLARNQFEKVPEIFESFDITDLYPKREVFHESEIFNFEYVKIRYFFKKNEIENATTSLEYLKSINPNHNILKTIEREYKNKIEKTLIDIKTDESKNIVSGKNYDKKTQTDIEPEFFHKEILDLYKYDIDIDKQLLSTIINLPRKTLVKDLEKIIIDAELRYEYFKNNIFKNENLVAVFHAFYILAEIQSKESLPNVLEFLTFNKNFINFWVEEDFLLEDFWKIIYQLSDENNYDLLFNFLIQPNTNAYAKSVIVNTFINVIHHNPKQRDDIVKSFRLTIEYFLKNKDNKELFDDLFLTFLAGDLIAAHLYELLPEIVDLYNKDIIVDGIIGTSNEAEEEIMSDEEIETNELFVSIFDEYEKIIEYWKQAKNDFNDYLKPELILFFNSLSKEKREQFLILSNPDLQEEQSTRHEQMTEFVNNLNKKQTKLFVNYSTSLENDEIEEEFNPKLQTFLNSLDENKLEDFYNLTENETDDEEEGILQVDRFVNTLNKKQKKLFVDFSLSLENDETEEELDTKLQTFINSLDENKLEDFYNLSKNETDNEEENVRHVNRFVDTLNKKQKKLFLDYVDEVIDDEEEFYKPEIIKNELKVGRNDLCPCGSGKKYKKCCIKKNI